MKAVILCAGKGTRMRDLTSDTPKPLLSYKEKSLIEHKLEILPDHIDEVVLVVGYLGGKIKETFGDSWNNKKIHYVEQKEMLGTAHALFAAKHLLDRPFLVLMGDDLYGKDDIELLSKEEGWAILVEESNELKNSGKIIVDEKGNLKEIINDLKGVIPYNLVYTGACILTPEIFDLEMIKAPGSSEYGLPYTFAKAATHRPIRVHKATVWKRITAPEDLV
jgi:NDP-sugar pyrophosphorylase family protein